MDVSRSQVSAAHFSSDPSFTASLDNSVDGEADGNSKLLAGSGRQVPRIQHPLSCCARMVNMRQESYSQLYVM